MLNRNVIAVHYNERVLADTTGYSPSALKPMPVVRAWLAHGLPIELRPVQPVSPADLRLAHDAAYVQRILTCRADNGFGTRSARVATSLPYTTGAMCDAVITALDRGVACAPVSGFHYARADAANGFCTFNGLIVAARKALARPDVRRVLILDCDMHLGDGTDAIIHAFGLADVIDNVSFGRWYHRPSQARDYLDRLDDHLERLNDYDLVLYQSGADVHVDDPLGGVLTTEQMILRDRKVFEAACRQRVPIAWNLAGGYQDPIDKVVDLHVGTMRECARVYA
jgi:acetoin utilization deacetylase AcuC-like enzyme